MKSSKIKNTNGITAIELLIIIMIIAILAILVTPNFVDRGGTRSPISRTKSDHRTIATALEAYSIDNKSYPAELIDQSVPRVISTPIAYLSFVSFTDPYHPNKKNSGYRYYLLDEKTWLLQGAGPDQDYEFVYLDELKEENATDEMIEFIFTNYAYDSSNGTESSGDIIRSNRRSD